MIMFNELVFIVTVINMDLTRASNLIPVVQSSYYDVLEIKKTAAKTAVFRLD